MKLRPILSTAVLAALCASHVSAGAVLLINEVDADQTSTDASEFIELYSPGGALALDDFFVVLYNGSTNVEYSTFDLDGQAVPADGFFVIGPSTLTVPNTDYSPSNFAATNAVQNGQDAVALYFDPTGLLLASDFFGTDVAAPPAGAVLVDALVYDTSDADDPELLAALTPGQPQIDENGNGNGVTESCSRCPDGGTALDTSTYAPLAPTPGTSNCAGFTGWTDLGNGLAGAGGEPLLVGTGMLGPDAPTSLDLTNANGSATAALFVGLSAINAPFKGGTIVPAPDLVVIVTTPPTGEIPLAFVWPDTAPVGVPIYLQWAIQDAGAPVLVALSNAISGQTP
ncbi:MAG: hypothetical protein H6825_03495 [Planctomycetes bacterium]|nr:hypothetical protein [Planctomycetota bacterium]